VCPSGSGVELPSEPDTSLITSSEPIMPPMNIKKHMDQNCMSKVDCRTEPSDSACPPIAPNVCADATGQCNGMTGDHDKHYGFPEDPEDLKSPSFNLVKFLTGESTSLDENMWVMIVFLFSTFIIAFRDV